MDTKALKLIIQQAKSNTDFFHTLATAPQSVLGGQFISGQTTSALMSGTDGQDPNVCGMTCASSCAYTCGTKSCAYTTSDSPQPTSNPSYRYGLMA